MPSGCLSGWLFYLQILQGRKRSGELIIGILVSMILKTKPFVYLKILELIYLMISKVIFGTFLLIELFIEHLI